MSSSSCELPKVSYDDLFDLSDGHRSVLQMALEKHGFVVIDDLPKELMNSINRAQEVALEFFGCMDEIQKKQFVIDPSKVRSPHPALPPAWGVGYGQRRIRDKVIRDQFHLILGRVPDAPWPNDVIKQEFCALAQVLEKIAYRCHDLLEVDIPMIPRNHGKLEPGQLFLENDPSVFDAFYYLNKHCELTNMGAHTDPGVFTVKPISSIPGIEIMDNASETYLDESLFPANSIVLFNCDVLAECSNGKYRASTHKVRTSNDGPRLSLVYELRCS